MGLICFIIGHRWSSWKYIKSIGRYDELLKKTCKRCGHEEFYKGMTDYSETGEKIPYTK
jgi:hypothetical protein